MTEKHYLHITGQAIVDVTYNYEILDLEKFKEVLKSKREDLYDLQDLWGKGIIDYKSPFVEYVNVDFDGVHEDTCYSEINGSSDEVEKILEENKVSELQEWYN